MAMKVARIVEATDFLVLRALCAPSSKKLPIKSIDGDLFVVIRQDAGEKGLQVIIHTLVVAPAITWSEYGYDESATLLTAWHTIAFSASSLPRIIFFVLPTSYKSLRGYGGKLNPG